MMTKTSWRLPAAIRATSAFADLLQIEKQSEDKALRIAKRSRINVRSASAKALCVAIAIGTATGCIAGDRTITLKSPETYSVPDDEIWKIADASVVDGPSTDLEFKDARVYVGTGGTLNSTFFLLAGDFDVSLLKTSDLYFFVQPGSKLRVGQRGPLQATVIMKAP